MGTTGKMTSTFSVASWALATAAIDEAIDTAFAFNTPTILIVSISLNVSADTGDTTRWGYTFSMRVRAYHSTTVNATLKTNLGALFINIEDMVTASGDYAVIKAVNGSVTVTPIE